MEGSLKEPDSGTKFYTNFYSASVSHIRCFGNCQKCGLQNTEALITQGSVCVFNRGKSDLLDGMNI